VNHWEIESVMLTRLGLLLVDTILALAGTAILESVFTNVISTSSIQALLWKEWTLNIICAAAIGYATYGSWKHDTAKWVWLLPALWFLFRATVYFGATHSQSVLLEGGDSALESFWFQFSGLDCANGLRSSGCTTFLVFTIPLVRGAGYSAGALLSSRVHRVEPDQPVPEPR
jgi:hypothetical protein